MSETQKSGSYIMIARCRNCSTGHAVQIEKGKCAVSHNSNCPYCGCSGDGTEVFKYDYPCLHGNDNFCGQITKMIDELGESKKWGKPKRKEVEMNKFPSFHNPVPANVDPAFLKKFREAHANTKFKPPIRGWRLFWCRMKWFFWYGSLREWINKIR